MSECYARGYFGVEKVYMPMKVYTPQEGPSARTLAAAGEEVWAPTLVGRRTWVSNLGRLLTPDRDPWSPEPRKHGYPQPYIRGHGRVYLHWLVLCSFEGRQEGRVLRGNKDKLDNRLSNLFWC